MEIKQTSQNQEKIEKLRAENTELKKNLEREQLLHAILYKEWKELKENALAHESLAQERKPKNLFYKYAFYLLLICAIPIFYFLNAGKGTEKNSPDSQAVPAATLIAPIKDSTPIINSTPPVADKKIPPKRNAIQQTVLETPIVKSEEKTPVVKPEEKIKIQADTSKLKVVASTRPLVEEPLTDSSRDSIYWQGWNAYYDRSGNHFKKSSEKYKIWLQGFTEGRNDAKKLLERDSLQKQK